MNILTNKPVMTMYKYSVIIFRYLNKYLYIISIFSFLVSLLNRLNENKIYRITINLIKVFIIINMIFGVGLVIYFTDFSNPLNNTLSFYYDQF